MAQNRLHVERVLVVQESKPTVTPTRSGPVCIPINVVDSGDGHTTVLWDGQNDPQRTVNFGSGPAGGVEHELVAALTDNAAPFNDPTTPVAHLDDEEFHRLLSESNSVPDGQEDIVKLLLEFKDVFARSPTDLASPAHFPPITITGVDESVLRRYPKYTPRYSHKETEAISAQVEAWLANHIVEPCNEDDYICCHNLLCAPKANGSLRICLDTRVLNAATASDATMMPIVDDVLHKLAGATIFSTIDLCAGYLQLPVASASRKYLAFRTPIGVFRFCRLPFGLRNACAVFNKQLRSAEAHAGLINCAAYFDDITVASRSPAEHPADLRLALQFFRDKNLKVNVSKSRFGCAKVKVLGHIVSAHGLEPDAKKTQAITLLSRPHTTKQLQSFLGLTGYYRKFVPAYATIVAPLTDLLGVDASKWKWTDAHDKAFQEIKSALCGPNCLSLLNTAGTSPLVIETDASDVGLGAVLSQYDQDGRTLRPVAHICRGS